MDTAEIALCGELAFVDAAGAAAARTALLTTKHGALSDDDCTLSGDTLAIVLERSGLAYQWSRSVQALDRLCASAQRHHVEGRVTTLGVTWREMIGAAPPDDVDADEGALFSAVCRSPASWELRDRLAAAWLRRGHPHGAVTALGLQRARQKTRPPHGFTLSFWLRQRFGALWDGRLRELVTRVHWHAGFPEHVVMAAEGFRTHATEIGTLTPLLHLDLDEAGAAPDLFDGPALEGLHSLGLRSATDDTLRRLADCGLAGTLKWVEIGASPAVTLAGLQTLAGSRNLAGLMQLSLRERGLKAALASPASHDWGGGLGWPAQPTALGAEWLRRYSAPWVRALIEDHRLDRYAAA